jgi:hypothetical protein
VTPVQKYHSFVSQPTRLLLKPYVTIQENDFWSLWSGFAEKLLLTNWVAYFVANTRTGDAGVLTCARLSIHVTSSITSFEIVAFH